MKANYYHYTLLDLDLLPQMLAARLELQKAGERWQTLGEFGMEIYNQELQ
jgi:hypothetical protein